jgi:hypothetical protein
MNILKAKKTMQDQGIPDEIIAQFNVSDLKGNLPEPRILFVEKMDKLLTKKQCLSIMENQGCCIRSKDILLY